MENHTKRIRKARRQGLAQKKLSDLAPSTRRTSLRGRGMAGPDVPGAPRPSERRKFASTNRKTKRDIRGGMRRAERGRAPVVSGR
jgi:hypothetical protein